MTVTGTTVTLGSLAPGDTFLIGTDPYMLLGNGFTASSGGIPIAKLTDGAMGPNVNAGTPVVKKDYTATAN